MIRKIIISMIIFILFSQMAFAAYYSSDTLITDEIDAQTKCLLTCNKFKADWTGNWFTTGNLSVCECFYSWPYCPVTNVPPPIRGCVSGYGSFSN